MAWEWQAWRLMDEIRYALEAKGWRPAFPERPDNEVAPLAAESGGAFVALVKMEPGTGECLFELRDGLRSATVILQGPHNLPTPQGAARLLAERSARLAEASPPHDRPPYEPAAAEAG
ncbi:MAG TPA: hypothetical protein VKA51_11050 [Rubrobacteraceae bacterium]|nr:hypothetical protein [Rubrobacteraceae bacterium]